MIEVLLILKRASSPQQHKCVVTSDVPPSLSVKKQDVSAVQCLGLTAQPHLKSINCTKTSKMGVIKRYIWLALLQNVASKSVRTKIQNFQILNDFHVLFLLFVTKRFQQKQLTLTSLGMRASSGQFLLTRL